MIWGLNVLFWIFVLGVLSVVSTLMGIVPAESMASSTWWVTTVLSAMFIAAVQWPFQKY